MLFRRSLVTTALLVVAVTGLTACAAPSGSAGTTPGAHRTVDDAGTGGATAGADVAARALPTGGIPDYQLGGSYTPPAGVTVVERDSTEKAAAGVYGICYVNGFQTQPEDRASWLSEHPDAVLRTAAGKPVIDPGWPDELILDTRTASARATITSVLSRSIARCADHGFDAVEFDNLDSWTRSGGRMTRSGNLALAASLVRVAHQHGLAAAQKNTPQLGTAGRERTGFDFVVAEECVQYDECAAYTDVYGARVIDVEYADTLKGKWSAVCAMTDRPRMTILRDRDLVPAGEDGYVFRHC
ncbi:MULTISPECIES: endo alpha-1,4 polygalactosaminidase [unclassified Curtobacterium]|uniref:endo alpha-1,4 polygalactosaminidase n=1 Tax=unclassified Curtobacterium TaxID=257496 RepID=UPI0021ACA230|nr:MULTISPECIES: endo alpha-1,4 polygalactosaminidase [unclassified Curtobacterium]MDN4649822.1 endo alpha-1,4 polygalactosaminidase [Curtobacterium sp. PsM8]WIE61271.1 endo alpha-1,4 polygalactosaminidase [Curtobacterium sp. MCLR17_032]